MQTTTPPATTMATATATTDQDRTHFLSGPGLFGNTSTTPVMGASKTETGVLVFGEGFTNHTVFLSMQKGGFNLHMSLSPAEDRTIAQALTMAADHADITAASQAAGLGTP